MTGFLRDSSLLIPTVTPSASAVGVLTSDNVNVSDGDTVTIGSTVYRFKTTIVQINDINIGAAADTSLTNLASAINGAGVPGTDYFTGTVPNSQVTSSAVAAHALTLTAINPGFAANAIATTETSAHLSFGTATLLGGIGGSLNKATIGVSGAGGQTINTDYMDIGHYIEMIAFINAISHSGTNPTLDCKVQFSDDPRITSPVWVDANDAFTQITTSDTLTFKRLTANFGRFIRFVLTLGGTNPSYKLTLTDAVKS